MIEKSPAYWICKKTHTQKFTICLLALQTQVWILQLAISYYRQKPQKLGRNTAYAKSDKINHANSNILNREKVLTHTRKCCLAPAKTFFPIIIRLALEATTN